MRKRILLISLLLSLSVGKIFSQPGIIARLETTADSFYLGQHIPFTLELRYPIDQNIVLPREADSLSLFEWIEGGELDIQEQGKWVKVSQNIQARSFSLLSSQSLVLPYAQINGKDTSWYQVVSNSLHPIELIDGPASDYLPKLYRGWWDIIPPPNYTLFFLVGAAAVLILFFLYLIFRKPFLRWQARRHVKRNWAGLKQNLVNIMNGKESVDQKMYLFGQAWRSFLATQKVSFLESKSSSELALILPSHPWLEEPEKAALLSWNQRADEVIYAESSISPQEVQHQYETLLHILENAYKKQLNMMKREK